MRSASRMAAALRQRYGKDEVSVVVSRVRPPGRHRPRGRRAGVGSRRRAQLSERLPPGAAGAQQGHAARARQPQRAGGVVRRVRARPGRRFAAPDATTKKPAARCGLFGPLHGSTVHRGVDIHGRDSSDGAAARRRRRCAHAAIIRSSRAASTRSCSNRLNLERLPRVSARGRRAGDPRADRRRCSSARAQTTPLSLLRARDA